MLESVILYTVLIIICLCLCHVSKIKHTKKGIITAYLIIAFISIIRYDIGWDYSGYVEMIDRVSAQLDYDYQFIDFYGGEIKAVEPLFLGLCWIFRSFSTPSVGVIGCYSLLSLLFIYKAIDDNGGRENYNYHCGGIFAFLVLYILFFTWDGMRQGLSIAIFLYATKYIAQKRFWKYGLWILIAAMTHLSILIALPCYFVYKIRYRKMLFLFIVICLMFMYITRSLESIVMKIYSIVPYYKDIYGDDDMYTSAVFGFGFGKLLVFSLWLVLLWSIPSSERIYANLLFIGICLYVISCNNLNITRIGNIFFFTIILSFPRILANLKKDIYKLPVIVLCLMTFYVSLIVDNKNGAYPYKTIFSEDFKRGIVREKE